MPRPQIRSAALILVLFSACCVYAAQPVRALPRGATANASSLAGSLAIVATTHARVEAAALLNWTLPPDNAPKAHCPWWLRILAVIGVLFFIRLVAGAVRNKPSGPGPV